MYFLKCKNINNTAYKYKNFILYLEFLVFLTSQFKNLAWYYKEKKVTLWDTRQYYDFRYKFKTVGVSDKKKAYKIPQPLKTSN